MSHVPDPVTRACASSLERSRSRRQAAAQRLRRRRRGSRSLAVALAGVLALGAPLAVGHQTSRTTASAKTLSAGKRGEAVREVQRALGIRVTGRYDARTVGAVKRFQRRTGLAVDGIVGPQTRRGLGLSGAPARKPRSAPATGDVTATLERIAQCESGGDPRAVSPDGRYRGKYQFSRATWEAMGGTGDPAEAPEAEQDERAAALLAERGTAPWPNCA